MSARASATRLRGEARAKRSLVNAHDGAARLRGAWCPVSARDGAARLRGEARAKRSLVNAHDGAARLRGAR